MWECPYRVCMFPVALVKKLDLTRTQVTSFPWVCWQL